MHNPRHSLQLYKWELNYSVIPQANEVWRKLGWAHCLHYLQMRLKVLSYVKTPDTMKINLNLFFIADHRKQWYLRSRYWIAACTLNHQSSCCPYSMVRSKEFTCDILLNSKSWPSPAGYRSLLGPSVAMCHLLLWLLSRKSITLVPELYMTINREK